MSYIGKTPTVGNFIKLDALTASATASYTMQHGGVNFQPESALHMLVSLNGVIQSPNTSFTISGSTITFSSALTSSDSIDFIMVFGNVLDIGTPSDGTVTNAKTNFVSTSSAAGLQIKGDGTTDGTLQLNCSQNSHGIKLKSPAHSAAQSYTLTFPTTSPSADKFLKTDGSGNLSFADAGGITMADQWRLTTSFTGDAGPIGSNLERNDSTGYGKVGTGMSESSGTFSFPSTGIYKIDFFWQGYRNTADDNQIFGEIFVVTDGSNNYSSVAHALYGSNYANQRLTVSTSCFFDVTDTSTHKVRFSISSNGGNNMVFGASTYNATFMNFIRLGDT